MLMQETGDILFFMDYFTNCCFLKKVVMRSKLKKGLLLVVVVAALGGAYAWFQWNKPARDAMNEKGISTCEKVALI